MSFEENLDETESEEDETESEEKGEEEGKESIKEISKWNIKKSTRKTLEQKFSKKTEIVHYCFFANAFKFDKLSGKTIHRCFICESGASYKIGIMIPPEKELNPEVILDRFVCETHKQSIEKGVSCENPLVPYLLGICLNLSSENWCPYLRITEHDKPKAMDRDFTQKCVYEYTFNFEPCSSTDFCSVCGRPAIVKIINPQALRIARKTIFFCKEHQKPVGCSNPSVLLESAPCDLFLKKSHCIFFSRK